MQLVEEAIDTSVVGHRARMSAQNSEIGSVYSPPSTQEQKSDSSSPVSHDHVEIVLDVDHRDEVRYIHVSSHTI